MRCERCKFENIPGQTTCVKCGSALQISSQALDIYPPRMPKWEKPFRSFSRAIRRSRVIVFIFASLHTPPWLRDLLTDNCLGLFLCLIPGLAHFVNKRFKEIWLYFVAWLVFLLAGIFLYGGTAGAVCLGIAVGLHVGICIQYGLFRGLGNFREKMAMAVILLIGLLVIYIGTSHIIFPSITGSYSTLTIPYYNISEGDYLLARTNIDNETVFARGTLVLIYPVAVNNHRMRGNFGEHTVVAEIIGLPGDKVQIADDTFVVNGEKLDIEQYPVPGWLHNISFSSTISQDNYFVSAQYMLGGHGVALNDSYIRQVSVVARKGIEGRVFMRWLPLSKRGFLQ